MRTSTDVMEDLRRASADLITLAEQAAPHDAIELRTVALGVQHAADRIANHTPWAIRPEPTIKAVAPKRRGRPHGSKNKAKK